MSKEFILADDIELINQKLASFEGYDLARDISVRLAALNITKNAFAKRVHVSHTVIAKWLSKAAKPHGKERFKELGMALGMDEAQLNAFLCANCYPRLYAKNPLDMVCRFVLSGFSGSAEIITKYRNVLEQYGLNDYILKAEPANIATIALSMDFSNVKSVTSFEQWLLANDKHFRAFDKAYIPNEELIRLILLYIGEQSINEMYIAGELPITIRNLLYTFIAENEVAVRGLRAKLIVFGLYENMTEDEIDMMLDIAKLNRISEPVTRVDNALLTALRCAHERYPYFEFNNARRILKNLNENDPIYPFYKEKERCAKDCVKYYESDGRKSELERLFEETYTDYADSGILHYISDIFLCLNNDKTLSEAETKEYMSLMKIYIAPT